jgi:hypothetical protein
MQPCSCDIWHPGSDFETILEDLPCSSHCTVTYQLQEWRDGRQKTRCTCHDCFPRKTTISRWTATIDKKTENGCWCDNRLCAVNTKDRYKEWNVGGMEVRNWKRRSTENDKREAKRRAAMHVFCLHPDVWRLEWVLHLQRLVTQSLLQLWRCHFL